MRDDELHRTCVSHLRFMDDGFILVRFRERTKSTLNGMLFCECILIFVAVLDGFEYFFGFLVFFCSLLLYHSNNQVSTLCQGGN